jgi:NADH:ubiquinone oxidoreductase subunit F (NADH-binding)
VSALLLDADPQLAAHRRRHGPLSQPRLAEIEASGLTGRGGASFPTAEKLATVARHARATVVANGAEGEPLSSKDAVLLERNPHLVLDGLVVAARLVRARSTSIAVPAGIAGAVERAIAEREPAERPRLVVAPDRFVAGEESALVSLVEGGEAKPTGRRPYASGILVQNVETLAHLALIARYGAEWFREAGTMLTSVAGAVLRPGVVEIEPGTTLGELLDHCGGPTSRVDHVLLGGYFGRWHRGDRRLVIPSTPVVFALPSGMCGLAETARIVRYLAGESAGQCGPCVFGLPALATALETLDLDRIARLEAQLARRGACAHPDGTLGLVASALDVFAEEIDLHRRGACSAR